MQNGDFLIDDNHCLISYKGKDSTVIFQDNILYMKENALDNRVLSIKKIVLNKDFLGVFIEDDKNLLDDLYHKHYFRTIDAKNLTKYEVHKDNQYFTVDNNMLYSKDLKCLYAIPYIQEKTLIFNENVEYIYPNAILVNKFIERVILPKAITIFYTDVVKCPFYRTTRSFSYTVYSDYIEEISVNDKMNESNSKLFLKTRFCFPNFNISKCKSSFIKDRLALAFMENEHLYKEELKKYYLNYIEVNFYNLYQIAIAIDAKKVLDFLHKVEFNFKDNMKEASLFVESAVCQNDITILKTFFDKYKGSLFTYRALLCAVRYSNKDILKLLIEHNFNLNLKNADNRLMSTPIFKSMDDSVYDKKLYRYFKCDFRDNFTYLLAMIIKKTLKGAENLESINKNYDEFLGKKKVNNENLLKDNIELLVKYNAISEDIVSYIYFLAYINNRNIIKNYLERLNPQFSKQSLFNVELILNGQIYCYIFNSLENDKVRSNLAKNIKEIIAKDKDYIFTFNKYFSINLPFKIKKNNTISSSESAFLSPLYEEDYIIYLLKRSIIRCEKEEDYEDFLYNVLKKGYVKVFNYILDNKLINIDFYKVVNIIKDIQNRAFEDNDLDLKMFILDFMEEYSIKVEHDDLTL